MPSHMVAFDDARKLTRSNWRISRPECPTDKADRPRNRSRLDWKWLLILFSGLKLKKKKLRRISERWGRRNRSDRAFVSDHQFGRIQRVVPALPNDHMAVFGSWNLFPRSASKIDSSKAFIFRNSTGYNSYFWSFFLRFYATFLELKCPQVLPVTSVVRSLKNLAAVILFSGGLGPHMTSGTISPPAAYVVGVGIGGVSPDILDWNRKMNQLRQKSAKAANIGCQYVKYARPRPLCKTYTKDPRRVKKN